MYGEPIDPLDVTAVAFLKIGIAGHQVFVGQGEGG